MFEKISLLRSQNCSYDIKNVSEGLSNNSSVLLPTFLTEKNNMLFIINDSDTKENIGAIYLYDINPINRNAWIDGFIIDRKNTDKLIISYVQLIYEGMIKLNLNKISAKHLVGDNFYKRIYDYLRFTLEGNSRDEVYLFEKFRSVQVRSLLKHEFNRYYLSGDHLNKMCQLEGF